MRKRKLPTLDSWLKKAGENAKDKVETGKENNVEKAVSPAKAVLGNVIDDSTRSESIASCSKAAVNTEKNVEKAVSPATSVQENSIHDSTRSESIASCSNTTVKSPEPAVYASSPPPFIACGRKFYFNSEWLGTFGWAELNQNGTKLLCKKCKMSYERKLFPPTTTINLCFISEGYDNWQLGASRLIIHETSKQHLDAIAAVDGRKSTSIKTLFCTNKTTSQKIARDALEVIVTSTQFLAKQGLPLRGHTHDTGNFQELVKLRSQDLPNLKSWLQKDKNFTSWKIQNEILTLLSLKIQRRLMNVLKDSKEFCLIADETTDSSGREQVSICVRVVDDNLCPEELFLGLYEISSTTADSLKSVILDALKRFQLSIDNLRAQCYDGAKNMSGIHRGVAAQISRLQPLAVYVHCYAHSLNLAVQDTIKQITLLRDTMAICHEISVIVRASPKRLAQFKSLTSDDDLSSGLVPKPMCPTRFLLRARSVRAVIENYSSLLEQLEGLAASKENISTTANGLCKQLQRSEVFFGMLLCLDLMTLLEDLSRSLQRPSASLGSIMETVAVVRTTLLGRASDDAHFKSLWAKMETQVTILDLEAPQLPRFRKPSAKIQKTVEKRFESVMEMLQDFYTKSYTIAEEEISHRFSQQGIQKYVEMESLLTDEEVNSDTFVSSLKSTCKYSFDVDRIHTNLKMLQYAGHKFKTVRDVVEFLRGLQFSTKVMYSELLKFVKILLLFPVSSCTSERSFSVLKRVRSYLRTTMSQERLNHCCILNTYREFTDEIDIQEIISEFVSNADTRDSIFGHSKL